MSNNVIATALPWIQSLNKPSNPATNTSSSESNTSSGAPSKTTISLDVQFKMVKESNSGTIVTKTTQSPNTSDDESSTVSLDNQKQIYEEEDFIRKKLSLRSYHLPGNNWRQDWAMYIRNNHLIFGLCCHHSLHPVTIKHRLIILLGSLAFGLSVTNAVYLWYLYYGDNGYNNTAVSIVLAGEVVENMTDKRIKLDISNGMAMLWTVGAGAHSMFDLILWHMIACSYCKRKHQYQTAGWNIAIAIVSICVAMASFVVLVRVYEEEEEQLEQHLPVVDDDKVIASIQSPLAFADGEPDFHFLYGYGVELFASLFVFTPFIQTILFSGVLGCGRLPFIGGRPRTVRLDTIGERKRSIERAGDLCQV